MMRGHAKKTHAVITCQIWFNAFAILTTAIDIDDDRFWWQHYESTRSRFVAQSHNTTQKTCARRKSSASVLAVSEATTMEVLAIGEVATMEEGVAECSWTPTKSDVYRQLVVNKCACVLDLLTNGTAQTVKELDGGKRVLLLPLPNCMIQVRLVTGSACESVRACAEAIVQQHAKSSGNDKLTAFRLTHHPHESDRSRYLPLRLDVSTSVTEVAKAEECKSELAASVTNLNAAHAANVMNTADVTNVSVRIEYDHYHCHPNEFLDVKEKGTKPRCHFALRIRDAFIANGLFDRTVRSFC
jgi:hypothetical protein